MLKFWNPINSEKQMIKTGSDIRFVDVSCEIGEQRIYCGLNFSIPLTGVTIIKGENGSGKSILMKLVLGMVKFQKGDISVGGVQPNQISYDNFPRKIFFLPQEDAEYHLTPEELYQMVLDKQEMTRALSISSRLGIEDETYTRQIPDLSGGERKKVFLSLAFALNPDVLIMDEPTNSLDKESCEMLYQLVKERTKGAIIITHDDGLIEIGSRAYEVRKGEIRFG